VSQLKRKEETKSESKRQSAGQKAPGSLASWKIDKTGDLRLEVDAAVIKSGGFVTSRTRAVMEFRSPISPAFRSLRIHSYIHTFIHSYIFNLEQFEATPLQQFVTDMDEKAWAEERFISTAPAHYKQTLNHDCINIVLETADN
jgi:hypothetical protein